MLTRLKFVMILIMIGVGLGMSHTMPADAQNLPTVNVVLGIDISGSHYSTSIGDDSGLAAMQNRDADRSTPNIDQAEARATDPNNIRYDSATSILSWLGMNNDSLGVEMNVNLINFADNATPWENGWTNITAFADPEFVLPKPNPSTSTGEADWGALVTQATAAFDEKDGNNTTNILFIITDSIYCTGGQCGGISSVIAEQIRALSLPPNTIVHLLLTPFTTNVTAFWDINGQGGTNMKVAVEGFVTRTGGTLHEFEKIDEMPLTLTQLLMSEVGRAKGRLNLPEDATLNLETVNWVDIAPNLAYADSASSGFVIPPYQAGGHFLTFLEQTIPNTTYNTPRFFVDGNRAQPFDITETWSQLGNTYQLQFLNPPPLKLAPISSGFNVSAFVFYTPAKPRVTIELLRGDSPVQYGQAQVLYELLNTQNEPFLQDNSPDVSAVVQVAGGDSFNLTQFTRITTANGTPALRSEPFFLQYAGQYNVIVDVDVYDFLIPDPKSLSVDSLTFRAQIGEDANTSTLSIARDTALPILVRAYVDGEQYPVPNGTSASLQTSVIEGNACGSIDPALPAFVVDEEDDIQILTTSLEFRESGGCRLEVALTLDEVVHPLETPLSLPVNPELTRNLEVGATTRLTISDLPESYEMTDYQPELGNLDILKTIQWAFTGENAPFQTGELAFEVGFVSATGDDLVIPPEFSNPTYPDRAHCTENPSDNVPFTLEIIDNLNNDQAKLRGICLANTASRGVYLANIRDLPAGDYTINIRLNTEQMTLNRDIFSYDSSLASNEGIFVQPISLRVAPSSLSQAIRIAGIVLPVLAGVFFTIGVAVSGRKLLIIGIFLRQYPLSGSDRRVQPSVALLAREGINFNTLWEAKPLPTRHTKVYSGPDFEKTRELGLLGIIELKLSTNKDVSMMAEHKIEATFTFQDAGQQTFILYPNKEVFIMKIDNFEYFIKHTYAGAEAKMPQMGE